MATSGDFSVTNNSSVETDGTQTLETPLSHNTIREGMSQFPRETLQASVTEEGSQNEQQLPGARKITSMRKRHPEEDDSESENSDQEYEGFKRFRVMSKDEKFRWNLPDNFPKYANEQFTLYTPEKVLQESNMNKNPIPRNVYPPKKMDDFIRELLLEKRNHFEITSDANLVKLQQRLLDVMGPLSKIWATVESAKNSQDEQVEVSLGDELRYLDHTVVLIG